MNKCNYSASSSVIPSIFVIHLVNGAQFFGATLVTASLIIVMLPLTRIQNRCNHKD